MAILKLREAGESATMIVKACVVVEGQYGEQVQFDSDNGDTLYVPKSSADRQLERSGFDSPDGIDYARVVGETVTFYRAPNPKPGSSPYWNLTVETVAGMEAKRTPALLRDEDAAQAAELSAKVSPPDKRVRYKALTEWVIREIEPLYRKADIGLSPEAAAAIVATIFISETRGGA
jgi:hypothetical protein